MDWLKYEDTRSYTDPGWQRKANRLALGLRMYLAGMIDVVPEVREEVGIFTVAKNLDDEGRVLKSRLVWDCRKVNLLFEDAPWVPLASPAALGLLELDEALVHGRRLYSWQGDIPDWFYRFAMVRSGCLTRSLQEANFWR